MWGTWLLCSMILAVTCAEDSNSRVVTIESGRVRGYKDADTDVFVFNGIPYATAPTGTDRYKAPLPAPSWMDVFEAVHHVACPQVYLGHPIFSKVPRTEDCLVANIYVPDTTDKNIPVVVNVHGGAYQAGFGNLVTMKHLVQTKKIIVVNFNYRLGVHGFLCLGTKGAPGNAGMKDQVALLRWVNKNIAAFGGDPNEVTISGYSAGSSAVDLLQLSPSTKGLFKRVIPEAGPNLATFSMQVDPLEIAKNFALALNFTNVDDIDALENFYKTASFELITRDTFMDRLDATFQFSPCVERDIGEETFLIESPYDILRTGDYPKLSMLYGITNMEGMFKLNYIDTRNWQTRMNVKFSDILPADLRFDNEEQRDEVGKAVKEFYFGDKPVGDDDDSVRALIDYFTDVYFAYGTMRSIRLQVEAGNNQIYLYEYSFVDDSDVPVPSHPNIRGANHGAQVMAVYDGKDFLGDISEDKLSEKFKNIKATARELWFNFMTKGKPVPDGSPLPAWPPANAEGSPHMSINETLELRGPLLQRRMRFWDDIYEQHYRKPVPPPAPTGTSLRNEL